MGGLAPWHWVVIIAALVVLFGSKRLPDAARGLGRSMRIFKSEIKEMQSEGGSGSQPRQEAPQSLPPQQTAPAPADAAPTPPPHQSA